MPFISLGLEGLIASPPDDMKNARLGLLCNAASVDAHLIHSRQRLADAFGDRLAALYSPQHGLFAEKQDNMIESDHRKDFLLGIPVYSLYSRTRIPTREMLDPIDLLLVDLQDVGTRVYTFIYTLSYCMEAAAKYGKKVVILDRPNPIGGTAVEGNCLTDQMRSFVGRYPIPMRHGMTIGELARLFNDAYGIGCDLDVVPMQGWQRRMLAGDRFQALRRNIRARPPERRKVATTCLRLHGWRHFRISEPAENLCQAAAPTPSAATPAFHAAGASAYQHKCRLG